MSLWFTSAAVLPGMVAEAASPPSGRRCCRAASRPASSPVPSSSRSPAFPTATIRAGSSPSRRPRRPRQPLRWSCSPGGAAAIAARFATGALLAGVYPVGMKIAVGWGTRDRGFLVGVLVGRAGARQQRPLPRRLPRRRRLARPSPSSRACRDRRPRSSFPPASARTMPAPRASIPARSASPGATGASVRPISATSAICGSSMRCGPGPAPPSRVSYAHAHAAGRRRPPRHAHRLRRHRRRPSPASLPAAPRTGWARRGRRRSRWRSAASRPPHRATFGGPVWITFLLVVVWGIAVIPDSAAVLRARRRLRAAGHAGSLLTFQTALGFALTIVTVQAAPLAGGGIRLAAGPRRAAIGPALGIVAMLPLLRGAMLLAPASQKKAGG